MTNRIFTRSLSFAALAALAAALVPGGPAARAQSAGAATDARPAVAVAAPAPKPSTLSDEVNEQLPEWLRFGGEYRMRWESRDGLGGKETQDDGYALSRLRLDLTFKLGDHVKLFVQGQDSQAWGYTGSPDPATVENTLDVRQAWFQWQQKDGSGWAVRAGRQELSYGDQRLVGGFGWSNTARSFDAVKLSYAGTKGSVDVFASSVVAIQDGVFDKRVDGNNFYGTHATFLKAVPKAELNTYVFWKTAPLVADEKARLGDADTVTYGGRLAGKLPASFDYTVELMGQRGSYAGDDISAAAAHGRLGYTIANVATTPKLRLEYNYASGDSAPGDGVRGTFDQLYPTNHDKYGIIDQVGFRNLHNVRAGVALKPHAKVSLELDYNSFWLAHRRDGLYSAPGLLVARIAGGAPDAHVAQEADVQLVYAVRPDLAIGAGYGHWFPGAFWKAATPGAAQNFVYSYFSYKF